MNTHIFFNRLVTEVGHNQYTLIATMFLFTVIVIFILIGDDDK